MLTLWQNNQTLKRLRILVSGLILSIAILSFGAAALAQQSAATLRGQVTDELGGLIVGATVTVADVQGLQKTVTTNDQGNYVFSALAPGRYTVRATAPGFAPYENTAVDIAAGARDPLNIALHVTVEQVEVTVTAEAPVSTEPENNAAAVVLRASDLDALPDDPDDLADALQALAGPSAGPSGGQLFIDGFSQGRFPPKESIREVRINRNPFSAEYDRLGYGRIEIFTKPATDKLRGQALLNFNDESLNSRNPFSSRRAPYQARRYGGNVSGPLSAKRASFFVDTERNEIEDNDVVNAVILDSGLNITPFNQAVVAPRRNTTISPRLDYQLNRANTLVARYTYAHSRRENVGVGDFSLLTRGYHNTSNEQTLQMTETAVLSQKVINETRIQYIRRRNDRTGNNSTSAINVRDSFLGGGSQIGAASNHEERWEAQNFTSWSEGTHTLRAGLRGRGVSITDVSPQNFGGTWTFAGRSGLTSIQAYQITLIGQRQGLTPTQIRALGGGATQFSIAGGSPTATVSQVDFSPFIQDDWRFRPNLTISLGLRYETQTNIHDRHDFAPRVAFAWSPGHSVATRQPTTVIRGGFGIFYDRFSETLTLAANRFNGINQQQFVVTTTTPAGASILDQFPNAPPIAALSGFSVAQTVRRVAPDLQAPYTMQTAISIERQLPRKLTFSASYINARTLHGLRTRNINAPVPATGARPFGNIGNIFEYESSGRFNQNQLVLSANNRLNRRFSLFANYVLSRANSDTDGAGTFPVNQYDLSTEYGRASIDVHHRFFLGGSIHAPWRLTLSPLVNVLSGRPFNITTGRDNNGDALFNDRPALAADLTKPGVIVTRFGAFDPNPTSGQQIIPRNFGKGPAFVVFNVRVSRTWGFGELKGRAAAAAKSGGRGDPRGRSGSSGRAGAFGEGSATERRYNLMFSINFQNLLNHTNAGLPIGNLSSPLFGLSNASASGFGFAAVGQSAGNRRIEAQLRLSF